MSYARPSVTSNSQDLVSNTDTGMLSSFIYSITSYEYTVPLWLQITMIIIIMISLITGGYFAYDTFDITSTRNGFVWFIFIAFLNLISILVVLIYYNSNNSPTQYIGKKGRRGRKGAMGKKGSYVSCDYCSNNIYLQRSTKKQPGGAVLNTYTPDFKIIKNNLKYFNDLIEKGNIDYDSFVNGIILGKTVDASQQQSITNFRSLMTYKSIAINLIENINANITKASDNTYGNFKTPEPVDGGYIPLGDSAYGGTEDFALNSFMVNGAYHHPSSYSLLITLTSYNKIYNENKTYSIWRPDPYNDVVPGFKKVTDKTTPMENISYNGLGDLCRSGTDMPKTTESAVINENCLEPVNYKDLTLVFIYVGSLKFSDESSNPIDYTQTDTYLITTNAIQTDIEIFSIWRTPLNTFITNCNANNNLINGTIVENMVGNFPDALTEYGAVSSDAKAYVIDLLESVNIPKILAASVICKHYEIELHKELIYYFNKYTSIVPEFRALSSIKNLSLGTLMNTIETTIKTYDDHNANLIKNASIDLNTDDGTTYDSTKERHLPRQLLNTYDTVNKKLLTIAVKIENISTFYDLINNIFDNNINTRIAFNSNGISEGGILLNDIQETIVRLCKMLMPPSDQPAYTIKDECLGTFALDRDREIAIKEFTEIKDKYVKLDEKLVIKCNTKIDNINSDTKTSDSFKKKTRKKYETILSNAIKMDNLMNNKVGQLCGYIDNYMQKIYDMQIDEFTTSRIKGLKKIYGDMVMYLNTVNNSV